MFCLNISIKKWIKKERSYFKCTHTKESCLSQVVSATLIPPPRIFLLTIGTRVSFPWTTNFWLWSSHPLHEAKSEETPERKPRDGCMFCLTVTRKCGYRYLYPWKSSTYSTAMFSKRRRSQQREIFTFLRCVEHLLLFNRLIYINNSQLPRN